ncbi:hypothetical protein TL16_g05145 [Triparma laevis f. inornata]|uniref:Uncharacterized protein n=1 Tax=Triparma laevis f. inornata TaxID=1714386 RepID=A0A9W7AJB6_9STRA|nr:hypothetical protein TL16_g05145 [Triparma laevis f. inornata]
MDESESELADSESESDSSEDYIEHIHISKKTESKKTEAKEKNSSPQKKEKKKKIIQLSTTLSVDRLFSTKCKNKGFPVDWSISYDAGAKRWKLKAPDGKAFGALDAGRQYLSEINPEYEPEFEDEEDKKNYEEWKSNGRSPQKSTISPGAKRKTAEKFSKASDNKEAFTPAEILAPDKLRELRAAAEEVEMSPKKRGGNPSQSEDKRRGKEAEQEPSSKRAPPKKRGRP